MTSNMTKDLDNEYVLPTYARFDLCLSKGEGCRAWTPEGDGYLDFTSGIGVNSLGFCDKEWVAAVAAQAGTLQHTSNLFYTEPGAKLAEILCRRSGMRKVFFANSGAEANEGAIKAARKYSLKKYGEGRHVIVSLENSFHGRTIATLSATGQHSFHKDFDPFLQGFRHVAANDGEALQDALKGDVCAVMLEVVQGEGGVLPLDAAYLQRVREICTENDLLLIADEVQTGIGRTGAFLASCKANLKPDIVTLAKGLGGGLPLGAILFGEKSAVALGKGDHASTYGMNPVAAAGALVVMERLDETFLAAVDAKGKRLRAGIAALPGVQAVSGDGLMLGILFCDGIAAADVLKAAMGKGLLCLLAKDRLRLLPPLIINNEEIDEGIEILKSVLEELA